MKLVSPSRSQPHKARARQRGISLVELAVAVAVVGIVIGGSLIPLQVFWKQDTYDKEKTKMAAIETALLGYAVRHQTRATPLVVGSQTAGVADRPYTLPAHRPTLPCPDFTGDGLEDRTGYFAPQPNPAHHQPFYTYFGERTAAVPSRPFRVDADESDSTSAPPLPPADSEEALLIHNVGTCQVARGLLPHLSLGVPPADAWGNRYTYGVDYAFAQGLLGFNQDTIADSFDTGRVPNSNPPDFSPAAKRVRRYEDGHTYPVILAGVTYDSQTNHFGNIVVCAASVQACVDPGDTAPITLAAGQRTTAAYRSSNRRYEAGDIVDGVPYVVVSHGHNGHFAVNHVDTLLYAGGDGKRIRCRPPAARESVPTAVSDEYIDEAVNYLLVDNDYHSRCPPGPLTYNGSNLSERFFMSRAAQHSGVGSGGDTSHYDDLLVWKSKEELYRQLTTGGVLPAPAFPLLKTYDNN